MRLTFSSNCQTLCVSLLAVAFTSMSPAARIQTTGRVDVVGPRPVASVIVELEKKHRRVISYEDPIRVHPSDIVDTSNTVPPDLRRTRESLVPKGGPFAFFYAPPSASDSSVIQMLESLVEQYNSVSPDAQFRVAQTREIFHVLPASNKDRLGTLKRSALPLDTIITLPGGQRSGLEQLSAIKQAVRASGYTNFGLGNIPINILRRPMEGAVRGESARAALVRVLDSVPYKVSFRVLCSGGTNPNCMLNIHGIPVQSQ